jgi:hypothetical protein
MTKSKAIETDKAMSFPIASIRNPQKRALKQQTSSGSEKRSRRRRNLPGGETSGTRRMTKTTVKKMTRRAGKERAPESKEVVSFRKVILSITEDDFVKEVLAEVVPFMRVGSYPSLQCLEKSFPVFGS